MPDWLGESDDDETLEPWYNDTGEEWLEKHLGWLKSELSGHPDYAKSTESKP